MSEQNGQGYDEFDFDDDLTLKEREVTFRGRKYLVREASDGAVKKYKALQLKGIQLGSNGKPRSLDGNVLEAELVLLAACLFSQEDSGGDGEPKRVPEAELRAWPNRVTAPLVKWVKEVSQVGDDSEETLVKEREVIDRKLSKLRRGRGDPAPKGPPASTTPTSS